MINNNTQIIKTRQIICECNIDELSSQIISEYYLNFDMVLEYELNKNNKEISFYLVGTNLEIDYGNGKIDKYDKLQINQKIINKYEKSGNYIVTIKGTLLKFWCCSRNIIKVHNWNYYLKDLSKAFELCLKLKEVPNYIPKNLIYINGIFEKCINFNSDISKWDVSDIKDMSFMFSDCKKFNSDISKWNVSNVINMSCMFYNCYNFNSDISKWNVSNAKNMSYMFCNCSKFNSDISKWIVSNVKYINFMFNKCKTHEKYKPFFHWYDRLNILRYI